MRVAVLGAGTGGLAAAVELIRGGHRVQLWNRNPVRLEPHRDGIRYTGVWGEGNVVPHLLTADMAEVLEGAEAVVACLPSVVHPQLFESLAEAGCAVPIVLNPGHTGGALHLRTVFARAGVPLPPVAEFSTLTYIGRVHGGVVNVSGRAKRISVGALPGGEAALENALTFFPGAHAVPDVLASSLANVNLVLHPPGAILGSAWVEATGGDFTFYVEGMTPGVARVLRRLDEERLAVAEAFGHELPTLMEEMTELGSVDAEAAARGEVAEAIRGGVANSTIPAPDSFEHRYYQEDLGFGLVPFIALAGVAGIAVPTAEALLYLGDLAVGQGLASRGLDAARLGIEGMTMAELIGSVTG